MFFVGWLLLRSECYELEICYIDVCFEVNYVYCERLKLGYLSLSMVFYFWIDLCYVEGRINVWIKFLFKVGKFVKVLDIIFVCCIVVVICCVDGGWIVDVGEVLFVGGV